MTIEESPSAALGDERSSSTPTKVADESGVDPCSSSSSSSSSSLAPTKSVRTRSSSTSKPRSSIAQKGHPVSSRRVVVPTAQKELAAVAKRHGADSWQYKAVQIINDHRFQHALLALLLLDVLILFVELFLDAFYPSCVFVERDAVSCCPPPDHTAGISESGAEYGDAGGGHGRFLSKVMTTPPRWLAEAAAGGVEHHDICDPPLVESGPAGCDDHKYPAVHIAHTVLFSLTIVILSIFEIELIVLLITLGVRLFFAHFLYVLDLFVVTFSLVLELVFHFVHKNDVVAELMGLLVLGRIWRFVRIGHGLVVTTLEIEMEKQEEMMEKMERMERKLIENGLSVPGDDED